MLSGITKYLYSCITCISIMIMATVVQSAMTGQCSSCHTMHNSQGGAVMVNLTYGSETTGAKEFLLRGTCLGCHAQNTASNIVDNVPQVLHTNGTDLASGNFRYVVTGPTDYKGHNVSVLVAVDGTLANTPPGFNSSYDPSTGNFNTSSRLTCAGTNGCHGDRDQSDELQSISGAHHGDDSMLSYGAGFTLTGQGSTVASSFRLLYKIKGAEDSDWHATRSTTDHNEYLGEIYASRGTTDSWANMKGTISELCSECHADYHRGGLSGTSGIGTSSPWVRHPMDVIIPNSGEYTSISTTYSDTTPVARPSSFFSDSLAAGSASVAAGTDRVMCLSCHRAHASNYYKMLRWDINSATLATALSGCGNCHTDKN